MLSMKLLITLDFPPEHGGIQRLLKNMVQSSFSDNDVLLIGCEPRNVNHLDSLPGKHIRKSFFGAKLNKKLSLFFLIPSFLKIIRNTKEPVDVECANVYAAAVPWLISFLVDQPYSVNVLGTEIIDVSKSRIKHFLFRSILVRAEKIFILTDHIGTLLSREKLGGNVVKRYPRISLPLHTSKVNFKDRMYNILSVGRLVPHKGHHILIQSAALLPTDLPWSIHIVGDGSQKNDLMDLINRYNLKPRIFIHTNLNDQQVKNHYLNAGVFSFPSLESASGVEGFGLVLLDAMAHGLAIAASASGGIPEVLDYGNCGRLVSQGDAFELSNAFKEIWKDPRAAKKRINAGYKHVRKFSLKEECDA